MPYLRVGRNGTVTLGDHTVRVSGGRGVAAVHTEEVQEVAWSPDGMRPATASRDETVRTWDAVTDARRSSSGPAAAYAGGSPGTSATPS